MLDPKISRVWIVFTELKKINLFKKNLKKKLDNIKNI